MCVRKCICYTCRHVFEYTRHERVSVYEYINVVCVRGYMCVLHVHMCVFVDMCVLCVDMNTCVFCVWINACTVYMCVCVDT